MYVFPLVIGKKKWQSKPEKAKVAEVCQSVGHYVEREASIEQAYKWILEGRCWRSGVLEDYNKGFIKSNVKEAYIIALDFDTCETKPEEMIEYCRSIGMEPNMWYYSFSQGIKPNNNYRIVWVLDKPIKTDRYETIYKGLLQDRHFAASDKACSNINRLWFGTCNGGELLNNEPVDIRKFDIYAIDEPQAEKKKKIKEDAAQGRTQKDFIMPNVGFTWWLYLDNVCDLWDRWREGKYLNYSQRLVLFTELKCLRYPEQLKESILNKIMEYYNAKVYETHSCNRQQISVMMGKGTVENLSNKIVRYDNKEYTISEYFNSGAYLDKEEAQEGERITPEELTVRADLEIPAFLRKKGIQYIQCQTGAGKTERIIKYLKTLDYSKEKVVYSVPTYALINEFIERLENIGFDMSVIHYPKQRDYTEEELLLLETGFLEGIITDKNDERQKELHKIYEPKIKGLFLLTHSSLTHLHMFEASTIIIDENIEETIVSKNIIPLTILAGLRYHIKEEGKKELDKLCEIIDSGETQEQITPEEIDISLIFKDIDYKKIISDKTFIDNNTGVYYPIGKLRYADKMAIGKDKDGNKYLYFEVTSKLLVNAIRNNISVKLFTGTAKLEQMKLSLPEFVKNDMEYCVIDRAKPKGKLYQYKAFTGSKYTLQKDKEWKLIISVLEENGVDWRHTNTLTLKAYEERAEKLGFQIPVDKHGEKIHIENCAGLDFMKGQNLIIIGKADKPKEAYYDMVGDIDIDKSQSTRARIFEDIAGHHKIHGFNDETLWKLQAEQMRQMVEQAADRARTLWFDNVKVYIFCDLPVRDATFIETKGV